MTTASDTAGVVAPPPLIYLAGLLAGLGLDWLWPAPFAPDWARIYRAAVLFLLGLALATTVMLRFRRAGTRIEPHKPTTVLVTDGLFRYSRNPVYVGATCAYVGIALAVDSLWMPALLLPVLAAMHWGVILREERYLEARFGDAYREYKSQVRRWL